MILRFRCASAALPLRGRKRRRARHSRSDRALRCRRQDLRDVRVQGEGYSLSGDVFEVHAIGNEMAVPHMPPVLDEIIGPVVSRITAPNASPANVLRAAEGCRVTREIISASRQVRCDQGRRRISQHSIIDLVSGVRRRGLRDRSKRGQPSAG